MAVDGVHSIYVETHNWGKSAKFWQDLGFTLDLDLGTSGIFRASGGGPYVFLEEVPADKELALTPYFRLVDPESFTPGGSVEVVTPLEETHWGTRLVEVRDPDGRIFQLEDPTQVSEG
jgi:hypothetical protein